MWYQKKPRLSGVSLADLQATFPATATNAESGQTFSSTTKAHSSARSVEVKQKVVLLASRTAFLADAMLGSLARKLRIFGYDTLYRAHMEDDEFLNIGIEHDRISVTCDRDLFRRV